MTHDRESGLLNYQSYIRCLSHENQEIYSSMGVAGIHIWDFKGYNQRYGHAGGDRLLAQLGEKIREIFKGAAATASVERASDPFCRCNKRPV